MALEVKVPVLPESVSDATIAAWHKKPGDAVRRDENLVDLETDKVVLEVPAPADGILKEIKQQTGATVTSQQLLAVIEEGAVAAASTPASAPAAPKAAAAPTPAAAPSSSAVKTAELSPAGQRVATENKIDPAQVPGSGRGGQVTKEDLVNFMRSGNTAAAPVAKAPVAPVAKSTPGARPEEHVPMTRMRAKIAERLMQSKNSIAMLTSFNEINLAKVAAMRKELGEQFEKSQRHQARLHELFRQGRLRGTQAPSDRQRFSRRQRRDLSRLSGHLCRRVDRQEAWSRRCCATRRA